MIANYYIEKLNEIPENEWASIWCKLNSWELPETLFGKEKPFPDRIGGQEHHEFINPIMNKIVQTIGMKKCLREWNKERMTDEEFESFWRGQRT